MVRVTEERALESMALHIAVAERLQCAEEEVARLRIAAARGPVRVEDFTQTEAPLTVDPQMVQEKVAEVASVVLVRTRCMNRRSKSYINDHFYVRLTCKTLLGGPETQTGKKTS